jgi:hypothetical protein
MAKQLPIAKAAHLLQSAGFGGPPEEVSDPALRGDTVIDYLVNHKPIDNQDAERTIIKVFRFPSSDFPRVPLDKVPGWRLLRNRNPPPF